MLTSETVRHLEGVVPVLPVPFLATGEVDESSFRIVVESAIEDGVHGLAIFGLASEYPKLTDQEKEQLVRVLIEQTSGRVPVIVSITHHSLEIATKEATFATALGADAIMILPPFFLAPSAQALRAHIGAIAGVVNVPVIVQYAPIQTGTNLTVETVAELSRQYPNLQYVKVDIVPSGPMVTHVQALGLKAMVGYMGLHLPDDVERCAVAVMPTVSVSRAFVHLWNLLHIDTEKGRNFHQRLLPLLNFMMQSVEMLVAIEKVFLLRRGLITSDYCRAPRWSLDTHYRNEIDRLCDEYSNWIVARQPRMGQPK